MLNTLRNAKAQTGLSLGRLPPDESAAPFEGCPAWSGATGFSETNCDVVASRFESSILRERLRLEETEVRTRRTGSIGDSR